MRLRIVSAALTSALLTTGSALGADLAFVTNQSSSDLSVIDLDRGAEVRRVPIPGNPAGVAVSAALGSVFVVSPETKTVSRVDPEGTEAAEVLQLDGGPIGIAVDDTRRRLFVSDWYNARIWVIDGERFEVTATLETGSAPAGLAVTEDGRWLVSADRDADQVTIFDAETLERTGSVTVGVRPFGLTAGPDGLIYSGDVGTDTVSVVDPAEARLVTKIPVGARPYGIAFAKGRGFVTNQYADSVTVFDLKTFSHVDTIDVGEYPEGIDVAPDGRTLLIACWFSNALFTMDAETLVVGKEIETGDGPRAFGLFVWEEQE